jgi:hypothetical protein
VTGTVADVAAIADCRVRQMSTQDHGPDGGVSYRVRSIEKIVRVGRLRSARWATAYGEFDPARDRRGSSWRHR